MAFPTIPVLNGSGGLVTVNTLPNAGQSTKSSTLGVNLASDDDLVVAMGGKADTSATTDTGTFSLIALFKRALGYLATIASNASSTTASPIILSEPYQAVAVSQTTKLLGATGAAGDTLSGIIIQPTGTTVGSVIVYDGSSTAVYTYPGGTVGADLRPIIVGMGMVCVNAGWHVTTPSNATVLAIGKFS